MWIARPIRVDVGKAKYLSQSLDKARLVGLEGLCESAVYVKHHEFHGKRECRLTRWSSAAATGSERENLLQCFGHEKFERTAGSRRLQRFVRWFPFHAMCALTPAAAEGG